MTLSVSIGLRIELIHIWTSDMTDGKNLISAHKRYSDHPCLTCSPGAIKHCGVSPLQAESHRGPPSPLTGLRHHRRHMPEACWRWRQQSPARARLSPRPTPRREAPTSLLAGAAPTGGAAYRPADAFAHRGLGNQSPHSWRHTDGGVGDGQMPKACRQPRNGVVRDRTSG